MLHKGKSIKYINTLWKDSGTERETKHLREYWQTPKCRGGDSGKEKADEWTELNCSISKSYNLKSGGSGLKNYSSMNDFHEKQRQGKD